MVKIFIMIMLAYSAKKNNAKGPAAYSTLNPETNSDSPSVRSKGVRLVSAKVEINHIIASGQEAKKSHTYSCVIIRFPREYEPLINKIDNKMIAKVTSYEIVWATARNAPISAYFELEDHPDHRMEYTDKLETARRKRTPRFILMSEYGMGSGSHMVKASVSARIGAAINIDTEDVNGRKGSLIKSFTASAIG